MNRHTHPRRKRYIAVAALAIASLGFTACSGGQADPDGSGDEAGLDRLRVVTANMPSSLDADSTNINDIYENYQVAAQYVSNLVRVRPTDGSKEALNMRDDLQPDLAESFTVDEKGVTFTLRSDAVSSAGNKLTSEDVRWSFDRVVAHDAIGALMLGVANVDLENPVTVVDDHTVTINTTTAPSDLLLATLDNAALGILDSAELQKHITDDDQWADEWLKTNTASFGAYYVTDFKPNDEITMKGNENYWDGAPSIDNLVMRLVPDASSRTQLLQTGSADVAMGIPPVEWSALSGNEEINTSAFPTANALQIWINTTKNPTDDPNLRRAISLAVDRDAIAEGLFPGVGEPGLNCTASPTPVPGFTLNIPASGDTEKAADLAEASGLDGALVMIYNSAANVFSESAARLVQNQLKDAGIDVQLEGYATQAQYQAAMDERDWDLNLGVQSLFTNHPLFEMKLFLTGDTSLNIPQYTNEEYTELVDNALATSGDESDEFTREACEIAINGDVPLVTLMNYPYTVAASTDVPNIPLYPYDRVSFVDLTF